MSTAFAIGTVFAESGNDEYRWIRRIVGYGVAGATGYVRIKENVHWLSDTVAGAALGIAAARFVLNRQNAETRASMQFEPIKNGWRVSYSMRIHRLHVAVDTRGDALAIAAIRICTIQVAAGPERAVSIYMSVKEGGRHAAKTSGQR